MEICTGAALIRSRDQIAASPSWLCCTRYQPPRLPRATSAYRGRRSGRHARVPFTAAQASALEAAYVRAPYLAPPALRALASALQLRDDRIKIWFQNRRARERREKSSNITPPREVTLPPTILKSPILPWGLPPINTEISLHTRDSVCATASRLRSHPVLLEHEKNLASDSKIEVATSPPDIRHYCSNEDPDDEQPDSPLDIETVEH